MAFVNHLSHQDCCFILRKYYGELQSEFCQRFACTQGIISFIENGRFPQRRDSVTWITAKKIRQRFAILYCVGDITKKFCVSCLSEKSKKGVNA